MLKKNKIKLIATIGVSSLAATAAIITPIVLVNQKQAQPVSVANDETTSLLFANEEVTLNNQNSREASTNNENNVAKGLAITFGIVGLIVAIIAVVIFTVTRNKKIPSNNKEFEKAYDKEILETELAIKTTDIYKDIVDEYDPIEISSSPVIEKAQQPETSTSTPVSPTTETQKTIIEEKVLEEPVPTNQPTKTTKTIESFSDELNRYLLSYIYVDYDQPANIRKYFSNNDLDYLPEIIYLNYEQELNFLYIGKNILSVPQSFNHKVKDVLVYSLSKNRIVGYSKIVKTLETDKRELFDIIAPYSVANEKEFNELYANSENAFLLFCDDTVRFENPIDPRVFSIPLIKDYETDINKVIKTIEPTTTNEPVAPITTNECEEIVEEVVPVVEEVYNEPVDVVEIVETTPCVVSHPTTDEYIEDIVEPLGRIVYEYLYDDLDEPTNHHKTTEVIEVVEEPVTPTTFEQLNDYDINEIVKKASKVEPTVCDDVVIVDAQPKDTNKDIIKANEQTLPKPKEDKITFSKCKIKTIVDKQTKENAPTTFIVTQNKRKALFNQYLINGKANLIKNQKDHEHPYSRRIKTNDETEMLKNEGKYYKFKTSTHPKVREEQIRLMNKICEDKEKK